MHDPGTGIALSSSIMRNTIETLTHSDGPLFSTEDIDRALDRLDAGASGEDAPLTITEVTRAMHVLSMIPIL